MSLVVGGYSGDIRKGPSYLRRPGCPNSSQVLTLGYGLSHIIT